MTEFTPTVAFSKRKVAPAANELPAERRAPREHFIPIRKADLVQLLLADPSLELHRRDLFAQFCRLLEATIHHQYHARLEALKNLYAPFDPDADPKPRGELTLDQRETQCTQLFDGVGELLAKANFRRLSAEELERALHSENEWGVEVQADLALFDRLEIYVRGDVVGSRHKRDWRRLGAVQEIPVPTFQRLALVFRLKKDAGLHTGYSPSSVVLKLFKNIPKSDVEMLLPGATVQMTMLDQGKIWLPTVSGLGLTVYKLMQGAAVAAFASLASSLAFLSLVGGAIGYGVKSFYNYLNTRDQYHLSLTRSLYFQNLDGNAGVLHRILDEAEEQEFREALLAWRLLSERGLLAATPRQLDEAVEQWLAARLGVQVDFEIEDALHKLEQWGLCRLLPGGRYHAVSLETALENLNRQWDDSFSPPSQTPPLRLYRAA